MPAGVAGESVSGRSGSGARISEPAGTDGGEVCAGWVESVAGQRLYRTGDRARWNGKGDWSLWGGWTSR